MTLEGMLSRGGFWYLATPFAKYPEGREMAFVEASRAAGRLMKEGLAIFAPISHTHPIHKFNPDLPDTHEFWVDQQDMPFMQSATGIIVGMLPTWRESRGIGIEIAAFKRMKKPVIYYHPKRHTFWDYEPAGL